MAEGQRINKIDALYTVAEADKEALFAFLADEPGVCDLLAEAHAWLERIFGRGFQARLQVVNDPEDEDGESEQLFAYLETFLPVEEALAKLDEFDEAWFLDALDRAGGKLNFNLAFS